MTMIDFFLCFLRYPFTFSLVVRGTKRFGSSICSTCLIIFFSSFGNSFFRFFFVLAVQTFSSSLSSFLVVQFSHLRWQLTKDYETFVMTSALDRIDVNTSGKVFGFYLLTRHDFSCAIEQRHWISFLNSIHSVSFDWTYRYFFFILQSTTLMEPRWKWWTVSKEYLC